MSRKKNYVLSFAVLVLFLVSCRKAEDLVAVIPEEKSTSITFAFENVVDGVAYLPNKQYVNKAGDTFSVSSYAYYVSNVVVKTDEGEFVEEDSYHLIRTGKDEKLSFTIEGLPEGEYTSVSFLLGVDAKRNTSGAQTGDLDPILGMFWDWNTGYIMARLEGKCWDHGTEKILAYHIAGFEGFNSVLKTITLSFPKAAKVASGSKPEVHIESDINEWFTDPNTLDIKELSFVSSVGKEAVKISDNYVDMFSVHEVKN